MESLLAALMLLAVNFSGLPEAATPRVEFLAPEVLTEMAYPEGGQGTIGVEALYDEGVIFLPESWEPLTPKDQSTLLHELVHHLQWAADANYFCRGASEKVAYAAQIKFLQGRGLDFFELFESDPLFIMLITTCRFGR